VELRLQVSAPGPHWGTFVFDFLIRAACSGKHSTEYSRHSSVYQEKYILDSVIEPF